MRIETGWKRGRAGLGVVVVVAGTAATLLAGGADTRAAAPGACRVASLAPGDEAPANDCCFTNPAYSGVCVVHPGEKETCASILAYLNNGQSAGRSYCDRTNVRGGWRQVRCEAPATPPGDASRR